MDIEASIAAVRMTDGVMLVLLLLFGVWGAMRGALRQALAILVLGGALYAAGPLAPLLEATVGKVSGLVGDERLAVAWLSAFVGSLVVGAILLAFLGPRLPEPGASTRARAAGALVGVVKGAAVLVVLCYFVLGGVGARDLPGLRRDRAGAAPAGPALGERMRGSVSASLLAGGAQVLTRWIDVPSCIRDRVASVNAALEDAEEADPRRRPREPRAP